MTKRNKVRLGGLEGGLDGGLVATQSMLHVKVVVRHTIIEAGFCCPNRHWSDDQTYKFALPIPFVA